MKKILLALGLVTCLAVLAFMYADIALRTTPTCVHLAGQSLDLRETVVAVERSLAGVKQEHGDLEKGVFVWKSDVIRASLNSTGKDEAYLTICAVNELSLDWEKSVGPIEKSFASSSRITKAHVQLNPKNYRCEGVACVFDVGLPIDYKSAILSRRKS